MEGIRSNTIALGSREPEAFTLLIMWGLFGVLQFDIIFRLKYWYWNALLFRPVFLLQKKLL